MSSAITAHFVVGVESERLRQVPATFALLMMERVWEVLGVGREGGGGLGISVLYPGRCVRRTIKPGLPIPWGAKESAEFDHSQLVGIDRSLDSSGWQAGWGGWW